jgi:sulfur relay protein TusB/DsrH
MSLHLVFTTAAWQACQDLKKADDGIVLLGDGAYLAGQIDQTERVYVLQEDLEVRGLAEKSKVACISYAQLVELTIEYNPIVSWSR